MNNWNVNLPFPHFVLRHLEKMVSVQNRDTSGGNYSIKKLSFVQEEK